MISLKLKFSTQVVTAEMQAKGRQEKCNKALLMNEMDLKRKRERSSGVPRNRQQDQNKKKIAIFQITCVNRNFLLHGVQFREQNRGKNKRNSRLQKIFASFWKMEVFHFDSCKITRVMMHFQCHYKTDTLSLIISASRISKSSQIGAFVRNAPHQDYS